MSYLQNEKIPFILLTNGGGKTEAARVAYLEKKLQIPLSENMIVQAHTPFAEMKQYHDKTVLVIGGDYADCKTVAESYGYKNVITPYDILCAHPNIYPFSKMHLETYKTFAQPLPKPIDPSLPDDQNLQIDAIFVYNDSRDWGLDSTILLDTLLSRRGIPATLSRKNGDTTLPNNGYLQDDQPPLYYSNPDLWWAASYHLNRLGQGGFQAAFQGLWDEVTGGAKLEKTLFGKPTQATFEFSENRLRANRKALWGQVGLNDPLRRVYMVGDNPESDIRGANNYRSPHGSRWKSILVRTGVYRGEREPSCRPDVLLGDVREAVEWAVQDARGGGGK